MTGKPEELRDRVGQWLNWANDDLALARSALSDPNVVRRGACTWAHQCAEKSLKAMLVALDIDPPRTHNLLRLEQLTPPQLRTALVGIDLEGLTRWEIEGRYPEDLAEATEADAVDAVAAAAEVRRIVEAALTSTDRDEPSVEVSRSTAGESALPPVEEGLP